MSSTAFKETNIETDNDRPPVPAVPSHLPVFVDEQTTSDVGEQEGLKKAFLLFNELSDQLSESYSSLEKQVSTLSEELREAHGQRLREVKEKQRVASRLQHLLDMLPGGVVVLDQHGLVSDCNPVAIDLLGEPLLGELWLTIIERCFAPRSDDGHDISLKDGRRIHLSTRSLDAEPGQIILLTDQTENRQLQTQLSRHERLSTMGRMMSSLAHQLRTPLSAAMLYTGQLCDGKLDQAQIHKFSNKVLSRLMVLEHQISDMLIFVKGDVKLTDSVLVDDVLSDLEKAIEVPMLSAKMHSRIINLTDNAWIHCNRPTIVGALVNLVTNAVQACGKHCEIIIRADHDADMNVRICVEDNGPGMDSYVLQQTKEPFFTTKPQGTGLGLAVVKAVASAHHGEFFLQSTPGAGTVAGITLPVQKTTLQSISSGKRYL